MRNAQNEYSKYPITEKDLSMITGGWWKPVLWFLINNLKDIGEGFIDGYETYHENKK